MARRAFLVEDRRDLVSKRWRRRSRDRHCRKQRDYTGPTPHPVAWTLVAIADKVRPTGQLPQDRQESHNVRTGITRPIICRTLVLFDRPPVESIANLPPGLS